MQHRQRQVELLLNTGIAGDWKMHLSELVLGVRPPRSSCDQRDEHAGHRRGTP
jgi:hypothetical protein